MQSTLRRYTVPSILASVALALALSACGDGGDDSNMELARYVPADALVYAESGVRPDQELSDNVDELATKLTGKPLSDTIDEALAKKEDGDISFKDDVEPWLGENAAMYVSGDLASGAAKGLSAAGPPGVAGITAMGGSGDENVGVVADTTDVDASEAFIEKEAGQSAKGGEYEGFSYTVKGNDGSAAGIVDDEVLLGSSVDVFKAMVDASKGDSLEGTDAFSDLSGKAADGSLLDVFVANEPIFGAARSGGFDLSSLYSALGMDIEDTGSIVSLVPTADQISVVSATNLDPALESGDPSALLETFPANSLFATGSGDIGANATRIIDAIDENGIKGLIRPGELKKNLDEASGQGIDAVGIIESLDTVGLFVSGDTVKNLGGALVLTSSDPEPLKNTLGAFSSLIRLAGDTQVKPLGGGQTGFSVKTPELQGRPIVVALEGDRLVVAVGMAAAKQALSGKGKALSGSDPYKAAEASLSGENVDMFGNPAAIAGVINKAAGGGPSVSEATSILEKFQYMVSGSGSEDNTFEFNLGLAE